jgi:hypothetical protein
MKVLLRIAIVLVALVAAVVAAELVIRALDPHGISDTFNAERYRDEAVEVCGPPRLFRHRPNVDLALRGFTVRTDSHGARGPELATPKPPGTRRAVFLGDSVTFGWGVDDAETFVARAAAPLAKLTGETWETVNLGHMFHDTTQELGVFDEVGALFEPDLVVLVFVDNDVVPTAQLFALQGDDPLADPNVSEAAKGVLRASRRIARLRPYLPYLSALLSFEYVQRHAVGQTGSTEHAEELGMDVAEGWALCRAALGALRERCAARGATFVVLDYYRLEPLAAFCAESGIPYGSIAFTPEEIATGVRNSDVDAHANARGHGYLCEHLMRELERLGLPR